MLWAILAVVVILWLLGFSFHIAGGLIHILLVVAVILLIINLWKVRDSACCKTGRQRPVAILLQLLLPRSVIVRAES